MSSLLILYIFVTVLMILGAGFFAGSETASISINEARLHSLVESGDKKAQIIDGLLKDKKQFIGMTLVGTNICVVVGTLIAERIFQVVLHSDTFLKVSETIQGIKLPETDVITLLVMTPIFLITSEIIPKVVFRYKANSILTALAQLMRLLCSSLSFIVNFISFLSDKIISIFGYTGSSKAFLISRKEFKLMVEEGEKWGTIETVERRMIHGILDLDRMTAQEIMVPIIDIQLIRMNELSIENIKGLAIKSGFSRFPVYEDRVDDIKGYVDVYDVMSLRQSEAVDLKRYIRKPPYVPASKPLDDLLRDFLVSKLSVAVVVDEYGSCVGWVSREDIIEEVVGEIKDEFDRLEQYFNKVSDTVYIINAGVNVTEFNLRFNADIPIGMYKTIAGFLLNRFGRVPNEGEKINFGNFLFEILEIRGHKISKIRLTISKTK